MSRTRKLALAVIAAVVGLSFNVVGVVPPGQAHGTTAFAFTQADPTITITNEGLTYPFTPTQVNGRVGGWIIVTNKDPNWIHNVRAEDNSFEVDILPGRSARLIVSKAGRYPYYCKYHPANHNPATLTIT
ncbi:MAG TPA: cupredoxin domain-containing protein [Candidatus Dormibacteraeota bacterium]|jgi:plastocyanin